MVGAVSDKGGNSKRKNSVNKENPVLPKQVKLLDPNIAIVEGPSTSTLGGTKKTMLKRPIILDSPESPDPSPPRGPPASAKAPSMPSSPASSVNPPSSRSPASPKSTTTEFSSPASRIRRDLNEEFLLCSPMRDSRRNRIDNPTLFTLETRLKKAQLRYDVERKRRLRKFLLSAYYEETKQEISKFILLLFTILICFYVLL